MPHKVIGDAQIYYEIVEGILPQDTVFIHGNLASRRWWYPSRDLWQSNASSRLPGSMILLEFRGCGLSSAPKNQSEVDMDLFAEDFLSTLKVFSRSSFNLVGHSTGGLIAALMLAKAPELFHRALLLDPVGAQGVTFDESMTQAFEQMKVNRDLVSLVLSSTILNNDPKNSFFQNCLVEDGFSSVKTVGDRVLRALSGVDYSHEMGKVRTPTLVLHGEKDTLLPVEDSKLLARLIPGAQFSIIPGQGHCVNVENPELFIRLCREFLFQN